MAAFGVLIMLLGMPILLADCGVGPDPARQCAAAEQASRVYRAVALLVAALAMGLHMSGSRKAVPLLLLGSVLPIFTALAFLGFAG